LASGLVAALVGASPASAKRAKVVDRTVVANRGDFIARGVEFATIGLTFIVQHVELRYLDQRWRQTF
jgi:hypothetical protein